MLGDHIRALKDGRWLHGIDLGDQRVLYLAEAPGLPPGDRLRRVYRPEFTAGAKRVELVVHREPAYPAKAVVARAWSRFMDPSVVAMFKDSEAFAAWCKIGRLPEAASTRAPAGAAATRASPPGARAPRAAAKPASAAPDRARTTKAKPPRAKPPKAKATGQGPKAGRRPAGSKPAARKPAARKPAARKPAAKAPARKARATRARAAARAKPAARGKRRR